MTFDMLLGQLVEQCKKEGDAALIEALEQQITLLSERELRELTLPASPS
jgi:hypothetical protein